MVSARHFGSVTLRLPQMLSRLWLNPVIRIRRLPPKISLPCGYVNRG